MGPKVVSGHTLPTILTFKSDDDLLDKRDFKNVYGNLGILDQKQTLKKSSPTSKSHKELIIEMSGWNPGANMFDL